MTTQQVLPPEINEPEPRHDATADQAETTNGMRQVKVHPLNLTSDLMSPATEIPSKAAVRAFNKIHRATQGIAAITQALVADAVARDSADATLSGYLSGGLAMAANVLAECVVEEIESLDMWAARRAAEERGMARG